MYTGVVAFIVVGLIAVSIASSESPRQYTKSDDETAGSYGYGNLQPDEADGAGEESSGPITVRGEFIVAGDLDPADADALFNTGRCIPKRRYSAITEGVAVRLVDDNDNLISKGALSKGTYDSYNKRCNFDVAVDNVPASIEGYWVQVSSQPARYVEHNPKGINGGPTIERTHFSLIFD